MNLFLLALALQSAAPSEWPAAAPVHSQDRELLITAWNSPLTTPAHKQLMLQVIGENSGAQGTDWSAARLSYVDRRARMVAEDAAWQSSLPWSEGMPPPRIRVTTSCRSHYSRHGYGSTICRTRED
jgi:hypothetical protein